MAAARLPAPTLVALLLSSLLLPGLAAPVAAGTQEAPELTDDPNDQRLGGVIPISTQPPEGTTSVGLNVDLLKGWVTESRNLLVFTLELQGTGSPTATSTTTWNFHFQLGDRAFVAAATQAMASQADSGQPGDGGIRAGGIAASATAAGDHLIVLTVHKAVLGAPPRGTVLTNLHATAVGSTAGQQSTVTDRAPSSGFGLNYALTGGGTARTALHGTLAGANVTLAQAFANATTATYHYNWTQGPANATVQLTVKGTGNATVTVRDAAGATLLRQGPRNGTTLNVAGQPGRWTLTLEYTAFKGSLALSIAPRDAASPGTGAPGGGPGAPGGDGDTPSGATTTEPKGTPGLGLAGLAAGLGAALLARRRAA